MGKLELLNKLKELLEKEYVQNRRLPTSYRIESDVNSELIQALGIKYEFLLKKILSNDTNVYIEEGIIVYNKKALKAHFSLLRTELKPRMIKKIL